MTTARRRPTIGALAPVGGGYYFGRVLAGVGHALEAVGGQVVLLQALDAGVSGDLSDFQHSPFSRTALEHLDGVVVLAHGAAREHVAELIAMGIPVVLAGERFDGVTAPLVAVDNASGIADAVNHLLGHGHRRIGFLGRTTQFDMRARYEAYCDALAAAGIERDPAWFFETPDHREDGGSAAAAAVVAAGLPVTALVCATDRNALGAIARLQELGVRVPQDIAVVGFDDVERGAFVRPTLATVDQQFALIGRRAGERLLEVLAGDRRTGPDLVPALFVPRESCGCGARIASPEGEPPSVAETADWVVKLLRPPAGNPELERRLRSSSLRLLETLERSLAGDHADVAAAAGSLAAAAGVCDPSPRQLQQVLDVLLDRLAARSESAGATDAMRAAAEVIESLWRQQAYHYLELRANLEQSLFEQYEIGVELFDREDGRPISLDWMASTRVTAGCLATWVPGAVGERLRIRDVYSRDGVLDGDLLRSQELRAEAFPPRSLIALGDPGADVVTYVIPIRSGADDFGLLAVVGRIDSTSGSGRESYSQWASLLTEAFQLEEMHERVRASEERYGLAAAATNDGLWDWSLDSAEMYYSERCNSLLGIGALGGMAPVDRWFSVIHPDDVATLERIVEEVRAGSLEPFEVEQRVTTAGQERTVLCRGLPVARTDGAAIRIVGSVSDIDQRKRLEARLRHDARHDSVTGLANRARFLEVLGDAVAAANADPQHGYSVAFLDLDGFKLVNDTLGHLAGDRLLKEVARRLERATRGNDTAARFGGDEFAVLLPEVTPADVSRIVDRMLTAISAPIRLDEHEVQVTASVGIAGSDGNYVDPADVLRDADLAMYQAKATRKGSAATFDISLYEGALAQLSLLAELRAAFDRDEFELHYQPIVSRTGSGPHRLEGLVRWRHPERGILGPQTFLPALAESGSMVRLGQRVIELACQQIARWQEDGYSVSVSVNISNSEFWDIGLANTLVSACRRHGVASANLIVEITEDVIVHNPELAIERMTALVDRGFELHVDDFGIGSSSLHALSRYPVRALKIDRSFVARLDDDARIVALVRAIVDMGHALGLDVIAEGVEDLAHADFLEELGCQAMQGIALAPTMDAAAAGQWLFDVDASGTLALGDLG
ncbi:MAG: EAL domain-containing protein [Gaiellales bacterium]